MPDRRDSRRQVLALKAVGTVLSRHDRFLPPRLQDELARAVLAAVDEDTRPPIRRTADPDAPCPHLDFAAYVAVNRITGRDDDPTVIGYSADITVTCADCGEPFRWTGVAAGLSPAGPMCSIDEATLIAPLRPASADPDFGLGLPGYAVSYRPQIIDPKAGEQP